MTTKGTTTAANAGGDNRYCSIGAPSISLAVTDLAASTGFYAQLGFAAIGGDGESWSILANGNAVIGLFAGMFDRNILTFNPGWGGPGHALDRFDDIRVIRDRLVAAGLEVEQDTTGETDSGPASFVVVDPDGNPVLMDQHV